MLEEFYGRPSFVLARIRASQFAPDLEALAVYLRRRGLRPAVLNNYMYGAAHLVSCLDRGEIGLEGLTAEGLQRFAKEHAGRRCSCPPPQSRGKNFVSVARHLYEVMRERHDFGLGAGPAKSTSPLDRLLERYDAHLRDHRGLRGATCARYDRDLRPVLEQKFGRAAVNLSRWSPQEVRDAVVNRCSVSPHAANRLASALRSFLRFQKLEGVDVDLLAAAIPAVHKVSQARLPGGLSEKQLQQLLGSIDRSTPAGMRTLAIVECLVSLGLRAGEVASLRLSDINWRAATLLVATSKTRHGDLLPIPPTVGQAIATYLEHGRPETADDHLFVRHYLPVGEPLRSRDVTGTVVRAFRRAKLVLPSTGAHVLRHTAASRLVRAGVSFKDVADMMRHRDINTTVVYAKVDWSRLAEVALVWPTEVES